MELKQLEAFVSVVELKSFSKAANKLFLTQPTISTHIQSLEKELGTRLLMRNTKNLLLSSSGEKLYQYAKEMLSLRDQVFLEFGKGDSPIEGNVTIAASTIPSLFVLPKILAEFNKLYPDTTFTVYNCDSGQVVKHLEEGTVDIGLTGSIEGMSNCEVQAFAEDPLVIVTPNQPPFTNLTTFNEELICQFPFITREEQSGTRQEYESYLTQIGIDPKNLNLIATIDRVDGIKSAIMGGLGISIMSAMSVEGFCQLGLLKTFTLNEATIPRSLYVAKLKHRTISATARKLLGRIKRYGEAVEGIEIWDD